MKYLLSALLFLGSGQIQAQSVNGKITDITVFLNGATITENVSTSMRKGNMNIIVTGLPYDINATRIGAQLPDGVNLLSISADVLPYEQVVLLPECAKFTDTLKLLENQRQTIRYKTDAAQLELDLLKRNLYIGGTNTGVNITELQKAADFYKIRQEEIYTRIIREQTNLAVIDKVISDVSVRQRNAIEQQTKLAGRIHLTLRSTAEGIQTFSVKYFTMLAAWKPVYDIISEDVGKPLQFVQKGKILNQTGKYWANVKAVLSTADPTISINRPELPVWELDYNQINTYTRRGDVNGDELQKAVLRNTFSYGDNKADMTVEENTVTVSELSNDFVIGEPVNIQSGSTPQTIPIKSYELQTVYEYTGIPELDLIPFLVGKTTDWKKLPLSDGPASIYIGKNYIGETYISVASITDTLEISLGRNKKVVMEKKKKEDMTSKSFFGNQITESFTYEISIKNNNGNDIVFELWDQVPVSKQEDIVVNVNEISGAAHDKQSGKLTWRYHLKPGEEKKIIISFSIKYPRNKKVQVKRFKSLKSPAF